MTGGPTDGRGNHNEEQIAELRLEIERLRARVAQLETEKAGLLRASLERDYERPPHYQ